MKARLQPSLSFDHIAADLNISHSTIRNWVRAGHLQPISRLNNEHHGNRHICAHSYQQFKQRHIGHDRLNNRANKLHADTTAHNALNQHIAPRITAIMRDGDKNTADALSKFYESGLGASHKNRKGIFYTPPDIVREMLSLTVTTKRNISNKIFCDPCCGTGNFIIAALQQGISPHNIYGFDTDPTAISIARARLYAHSGYVSDKIMVTDFLANSDSAQRYDIIATNPPWGFKMGGKKGGSKTPAPDKQKLDSSAMFALACLNALAANGALALLLPEAFFNIKAYQLVRAKLLDTHITHLLDYQKPFAKLQTRAQAIIVTNNANKRSNITCRFDGKNYQRKQQDFCANPALIYNFYASPKTAALIAHLYRQPHITLKNRARWALGIVTGNNKKFITHKMQTGYVPIYKGSDIGKNCFQLPSHFIPDDFSHYQQVAPLALYHAREKIAYRFINQNLICAYDDQQRYFLNSANMLILHDDAGINAKQLTFLLNSTVMNFLFQHLFRTHKILRTDLESLPIFADYFATYSNYDEASLYDYLGIADKDGGFTLL
ncbi:MAG: N-6 DNA methylase [Alphaproteobacteria bacterium]|nr:N-6 DNA methylase [Alphaproteobacteria bacterium]